MRELQWGQIVGNRERTQGTAAGGVETPSELVAEMQGCDFLRTLYRLSIFCKTAKNGQVLSVTGGNFLRLRRAQSTDQPRIAASVTHS